MDGHLGLGPHGPGPFSLPREIAAVVLLGAALAALPLVKARCPDVGADGLWAIAGTAALLIFFVVPLQALAIVYVAGILAATSWRSPAANVSLAAGVIAGLGQHGAMVRRARASGPQARASRGKRRCGAAGAALKSPHRRLSQHRRTQRRTIHEQTTDQPCTEQAPHSATR